MRRLHPLLLLIHFVLVATAAEAFTPTRLEACCQSVQRASPDPSLCGAEPPSAAACDEVLAGMARAASAQHQGGGQPATADPGAVRAANHDAAVSPLPGIVGWIFVAGALLLASVALRRIGAGRIVRFIAPVVVFVAVTFGATWGIWATACAVLRCVDTMGLGILVVATLPAAAIGAWAARRLVRRFAVPRT